MRRFKQLGFVGVCLLTWAATPCRADSETDAKIEKLERELQDLKREVRAPKPTPAAAESIGAAALREVSERVKLGGYGSFRYEGSDLADQKHTFTFRRLVLTTDANIAPRLRSYFELEFERFRKLEVEKEFNEEVTEEAIEATNESEISLEQAWLQFDIADWLRFRGGAVLVPLGRFNLNHDDNRWDLPRRSLVDRGVPALPSKAAWDELGVGFTGDVPLNDDMVLGYHVYVVNGVALDAELEKKVEVEDDASVAVTEVKITPSTGGFAADVKDSKAFTGRISLSPALGHEIAGSWYYGQYTPDFLGEEDLWSLALDGHSGYGPFEIEGQMVFTRFEGVRSVAEDVARHFIDQSRESGEAAAINEVEFELTDLARNKYGYWLDLRYRFWPQILNQTFLGSPFDNPQLIAVLRGEQVWIDDRLVEVDFAGSELTSFETENRRVDRVTVGLAYRPVPLVAFQLAYEYTQTNTDRSLSDVTNFLPARPHESSANTVLLGTAFGF